jgi:glutamine amidotransferase
MAESVAIIDSGGANIASLQFALDRLGYGACLTTAPDVIRSARDLRQPVLGICLGMQLLADASEEEDVDCLGIIPGIARRLQVAESFPVPNMGWCPVTRSADSPVLEGIRDGSYFYFVHSYALPVSGFTLATARHAEGFSAVIGRKNFVAAQFHPERSSADGARLLRNFLELTA